MTTAYRAEGWYADPVDSARQRWWDGVSWTSWARDAHVTTTVSTPATSTTRVRDSTTSIWWIATSPSWLALSSFAVFGFSLASPMAGTLFSGLPLIFAAALFVLASRDRDLLRTRGCSTAASPFWMLLSPAGYLVMRWLALRQHSVGSSSPLIAFVLQSAILGGIIFIWSGLQGLSSFTP